jgi:hypothetical protein
MAMNTGGMGPGQPEAGESAQEREDRRWEEAIRPLRERFPDPAVVDARVKRRRAEGWSILDVQEELAELAEEL